MIDLVNKEFFSKDRDMIIYLITGPESTGKSTLTQELTKHFDGIAVKEYAREYIENLEGNYTFEDVETIAWRQVEEYRSVTDIKGTEGPVFLDTFLFITKVWFEEVFNCCPIWLHKSIKDCRIDKALLCFPDLPWEPDGVRENPHRREYLYNRYLSELTFYDVPFCLVKGENRKRFENAISCIVEERN